MRTALKKLTALLIAILFFNFSLFSQVTQPGGVVSYVIKKEAVTDPALIPALINAEMARAISYVDGFGRPLQNIVVAGSPNGKDIVSFSKYDVYGRQPKQYLPFEATTTTGAYNDMSTIVFDQSNFYSPSTSVSKKIAGDDYPYTESSFETSPLGRVLKVGGVGDGFQITQHYKTMSYHNGLASENIRKWVLGSSTATSSATYGDDELIVSEVTDENNIHAWIYKDRFGRLTLKRQDGLTSGHYYDTYYVYDNIGNIAYIVPPKAIAKLIGIGGTYSTTSIPELIYQFWYDGKNRINQKKVPGAKEVYMIYDPLDRIVFTQDGNMRSSSGTKWAYVKYDNANRVIIQGIYTHGSVLSQSAMQSYVDGQTVYSSGSYYEIRQSGTSGYSNQCFPTSSTEERGYNYYDDYDFDLDFNPDYSKQAQGLTNEATATNLTYGLATGTKKKILGSGTPGTWLIEATFYDKYYHVIQVRSNNQIKTAVTDHTTNVVNFAGQAMEAKQVKVINDPYGVINTLVIQVSTRYEYDDMGRLIKVFQTNPGSSELIVAQYEYNVIGQLVDKKLHSIDGGINYLQSVDMRYNIRGQLTSINNSTRTYDGGITNDEADDNDVFGMEILYDKAESTSLGNTQNYTGMISAVKWSASTPANPKPDERSFIYSYDNLYRLSLSRYQAKAIDNTWTKEADGFNESLTYDENGNIMTLYRNAMIGGNRTTIDDLTYSYKNSDNENQLKYIDDRVTNNTTGYGYRNFTGTTSMTPYSYDDNGNLTTDLNKGTTISYNEQNKPTLIQISSTKKVEYRYDAAGTRISKYVTNSGSTKYIEYIGGYVIENDVLSYYSMAEGRVRNGGGGYSLTLAMEYFITDHQGNTRVSFEDDGTSSNTAIVTQENSYYAFGMQMAGGWTPTNPNKKLYNAGSEWQDDIEGLADYYSTFYREYDPIIGRFNGVDPLSENFESWTTYQYSYNNPINFNDPNGDMAPAEFENAIAALLANGGGTYHSSTSTFEFGQENAKMGAVESMIGMNFSEFLDQIGSGGSGGGSGGPGNEKDRFLETGKRAYEILNAKSYSGMGLKQINYFGDNFSQFKSDIEKIAKVQAGAIALAMIETSGHMWEVADNKYTATQTGINKKEGKVYTFYGAGRDEDGVRNPSYIVLAHELFHAVDYMAKHFDKTNYLSNFDKTDPMYNQPKLSRAIGGKHSFSFYMELRAVVFENAIRIYYNDGFRTRYGGVELGSYYSQMH